MSSQHEKKNVPAIGRARRPKTAARPALESLEDRALLNGSRVVGVTVSNPQAYVTQLYRDLLNRQVETAALNQDVQLLSNGRYSASQLVTSIENGIEYRTNISRILYTRLLGTSGATNDLVNGGAAYLGTRGATIEKLGAQILGSSAFFTGPGGNTNTTYVNALYQFILGRTPVGTEAQGFVTSLNNGASRQSVVQQLLSSPEGSTGLAQTEVNLIYGQLLHRAATNDRGADPFVNGLQRGRITSNQIVTAVATSQEYVANTGGTLIPLRGVKITPPIVPIVPSNDAANRNYVNSLYRHLLNRAAEADALTFYANQLDGARTPFQASQARMRVSSEIINSTEFRQTTINTAVQTLLGRPATQAELNNPASFENQAIAFLSSDAYFNSPAGGGGSNPGYLNALYRVILGRTGADPAGSDPGSAPFLRELNSNVARSTVVRQIAGSPEGSAHVSSTLVNLVYARLLGRPATGDPGATPWINSLGRGLSLNQFVINIAASQEFYSNAQGSTII